MRVYKPTSCCMPSESDVAELARPSDHAGVMVLFIITDGICTMRYEGDDMMIMMTHTRDGNDFRRV